MSLKLNLSRCNIQIYNMLSVNVMSDEFIKKTFYCYCIICIM